MTEQQINKQEFNLQTLQQQLSSQDMQISRLQIQNNALNGQIDAIHASLSWKITAPLRVILKTITALHKNLITKIQSSLIKQVRKLLLRIYQITWIKKQAIAILERFPVLQKRLIRIMHKQNTYMSNPYYNNNNIVNKAYLPKTARNIYSELLTDTQSEN